MPQSCPSTVDGHRRTRGVTFNPAAVQRKETPTAAECHLPPRYQPTRELGRGAYGKVVEAFDSKLQRGVAVKRIKNLFLDATDCKRILREISILSALDHNNIIRLIDLPLPSDLSQFGEINMVLELAETDLQKLLRGTNVALTPLMTCKLFHGVLLGLKYLHSAGIYHRDLKPANCLANRDCTVKLADFGLSRAIGGELQGKPERFAHHAEDNKRIMTGHVVTRWYRAPELCLLEDNYTEAIDVWSAACIYAELVHKHTEERGSRWILFQGQGSFTLSPNQATGKKELPGWADGSRDQLREIFNVIGTPTEKEINEMRPSASEYLKKFAPQRGTGLGAALPQALPEMMEVLEGMLQFRPKGRMTIDEALRHRLFAEFSDESQEVTAHSLVALEYEGEKMDEARLRHYFCKEIRKFHPETPEFI